ncbi:isochorismate pyruvate lyase [Limimonas halophila]|uniref:chorismate mutase n=1 Tax=Limimonas halophila TaxID=1082479 RepID=A0A1G7VCE3_9PROT|nr:chorismate mutase [Limimonas halophila]SDG57019.1 isochorismate pyruvate lyase [Limimonas halophila]
MTRRPEDCTRMADIREGIDALDEELVALVARRMRYIARAAEIKERPEDIRDDARVEDVVAKVRAAAEREGLRPDLAEAVWRTLVETSIQYEAERYRAE